MRQTKQLLVALGLLLIPGAAQADTVDVDVRVDSTFRTVSAVPGQGTKETTINVGDTVRWTWRGGFHSVEADDESFASDFLSMVGATFTFTFNSLGDFRYYCGLHGGPGGFAMSGTIHVRTKISGTLALEGCSSAALPLIFTLHPSDSSGDITRTVTPAANGSFSLLHLPAKNYTVRVKGAKWLAVSGAANTSSGNVTNLNLGTLRGGDADNSNLVDVEDLNQLIQAFDATSADPNWNQGKADFNCDDIVDVEDLSILIRNFDSEGA